MNAIRKARKTPQTLQLQDDQADRGAANGSASVDDSSGGDDSLDSDLFQDDEELAQNLKVGAKRTHKQSQKGGGQGPQGGY